MLRKGKRREKEKRNKRKELKGKRSEKEVRKVRKKEQR